MFTALAGIMVENEEITVKVTGPGKDGRMKVMVMPKVAKGSNLALAQPLAMAASPQELDAGFVGALMEFGASRTSLAEQVAVTTTIMGAAQKTEAGKAAKALQTKAGSQAPTAGVTVTDGDGDDDESDDAGAGTPDLGADTSNTAPVTPPARPAPAPAASANDDLIALMG